MSYVEVSEYSGIRSTVLSSDDFDIPALLRRAATLLDESPTFFAVAFVLQSDEFGSRLIIYGHYGQTPALSSVTGYPEDATRD